MTLGVEPCPTAPPGWATGMNSRTLSAQADGGRRRQMSVVTTEQRGPVSIIRINRPEKLNAISSRVAVELQQAFQAFDASDQRVAILSAAGARVGV